MTLPANLFTGRHRLPFPVDSPPGPREHPDDATTGLVLRSTDQASDPVPAGASRAQTSPSAREAAAPPIVHEAVRSSGRPLEPGVRALLEPRFRHDFGDVRIHTDARAGDSAHAVQAVAYTVGRDIVFAPGQYQPGTPEGLHLIAHELGHVVQQAGAPRGLSLRLAIGPTDDPLEREADRSADAVLQGASVSLSAAGAESVGRVQRAVSKVCNPPSVWFVLLGGPQNLPAAVAFGAIAEAFISASVIAQLGVTPGNFYFDNPLAGPVDPVLVNFIITKNPWLSLAQRIALGVPMPRPDVLMHQAALTEFEEVKPNSIAGRAAGRLKVRTLSAIYSGFTLPYTAGATYTPPPPIVIASGIIPGTTTPITITFEITRDRNGLLVYDICVETDWLVVSALAIAVVIAIILALIAGGVIGPVPIPAPVPAVVMNEPPSGAEGEAQATTETESAGGEAEPVV